MFTRYKNNFLNLGYTRYKRVLNYLGTLEDNFKITSKKDKQIISDINSLIEDKVKYIKRTYVIINSLYVGIYLSIVSFFFNDLFILSEFVGLITDIVGFFGTTIFLIAIFFVSKVRELYYQDLHLLTSHLISIYNNNELKDKNIFDEVNKYNVFLNFFKKRGFEDEK